ncbi:MAG: AraC family transcriptional regulator [Ruminococcaceae bacterium]|nr:AraC family transcriptional regulator [Oscillospiraceae bacterium]
MYNGIQKIENIIDYIETHITEEIDYDMLSSKMLLSLYEFRRIFSFVVACPISEYIRKRRLSLAATEIMTKDNVNLQHISEKYGYSNQSAFTRAFKEHHGVAPSACLNENPTINLFTRPNFSVSISGREDVPFRLIKTDEFCINGFSGISPITDSCCCEDVWNAFYESGADKALNTDKIYVSYLNQGENVSCNIGEKSDKGQEIPSSRWACFTLNTVDDDIVNEIYCKIIYEWLPSANLKRNKNIPTVEVYPFDMSEEGFEWEIRIPID